MIYFIAAILIIVYIVSNGDGSLEDMLLATFCGTVMVATGISDEINLSIRIIIGLIPSAVIAVAGNSVKGGMEDAS